MFILDNEFSGELCTALIKRNIQFQLVPPYVHRRNAAERAIQMFKNHFLSVLATCDTEFPIVEWDRLLPQTEMTLNMLRPARLNPKMSLYMYLNGPHNFLAMPLAPAGTKVVIHMKPDQRSSWAYHGKVGWYVGPAPHHYRCFRCYVPSSGKEIITDTVRFIPGKVTLPTMSTETHLKRSLDKIINILQSINVATIPMLEHKDTILKAFKQVSQVLNTNKPIFAASPKLVAHDKPLSGPLTWVPKKKHLGRSTFQGSGQ